MCGTNNKPTVRVRFIYETPGVPRWSGQPHVCLDCEQPLLFITLDSDVNRDTVDRMCDDIVQVWRVPTHLTPTQSNALLECLMPLAQMVVDGFTTTTDDDGRVARFNDRAQQALSIIDSICRLPYNQGEDKQ